MWDVITDFNQYPAEVNSGTKSKIYEFTTMISSFNAQLNKLNAYELADTIAQASGVMRELMDEKEKGPEEVERYQNIEELLSGIQEFVKSGDSDEGQTEDRNHVSLMTIHASKGLEFPYVFLVGLEENLFPSQMSLNTRTELEEERRLFYVAVTRAMNACTLSYASSRFVWGQLIISEPSRFID
jgi:DNA helicase-2/ATP-dependent DNA helicase PcrA